MKQKLTRSRIVLALCLSFVLGSVFFIGRQTAAAPADQPHMQAALSALETAQQELAAAQADKGGHRVKAERYVHDAIDEVRRGIEYDRTH
jgi:hypothetical protein